MTENRLNVSMWFGQSAAALPSETDITPRHFRERYIADRRARLGFENVRQIEEIIVGQIPDRAFDISNVFDRAITAIGKPLHSCLEHALSYHEHRGAGISIRCPASAWSAHLKQNGSFLDLL
jgi:hypothetical protein